MDILTILFFLLGITLTSFYILIADRVPNKKTILGRSECNICHKNLRFIDVIPLVGYIINLGKCHSCKNKINIKYPLIELLGGLVFSASYHIIGIEIELVVFQVLFSVLLIETISDIEYKTVIDSVWIIGLIILVHMRIFQGTFFLHLLSSVILFAFLWAFAFIGSVMLGKVALGGGDVKLYIFIGFALTLWPNVLSLFLACIMALMYILIFKKTKVYIPLVPFIAVSVIITYFFGNQLIDWYLGLFGM
jgi:prepilin signal peptidase PulO-like enzyme (type II secretory pathway)